MAEQNFGPHTPIVPVPRTAAAPTPTATPQPAPAAATTPPANTNGLSTDENSQLQSASGLISSFLQNVPGLSSIDPEGALGSWMNATASQLAGQGLSSGDIFSTIEATMNNPGQAPAGMPQDYANDAQRVFDQLFPGYNQRIQNGDGNGGGIQNYLNYAVQINAFGTQAGLLPGTIDASTIGNLWANDVSSTEVSERVTLATVTASAAPQQVKDYMAANGINQGGLASYYLNPANTLQTIQTGLNTGMVGGEAAATGFSSSLSTSQAAALGAFLANGSSAGSAGQIGGVNAVTAGNANSFFTSNVGTNTGTGGSIGSISSLAQGGYEAARPGQSSTGTVDEQTLLAAGEGDAAAIARTAQAQQARTAGSKGGGGATTTANGAVGLGYAAS